MSSLIRLRLTPQQTFEDLRTVPRTPAFREPPQWWQYGRIAAMTCQAAGAPAEADCRQKHVDDLDRRLPSLPKELERWAFAMFCLMAVLVWWVFYAISHSALLSTLAGVALLVGLAFQRGHEEAVAIWDAHVRDRKERTKTPEAETFHDALDALWGTIDEAWNGRMEIPLDICLMQPVPPELVPHARETVKPFVARLQTERRRLERAVIACRQRLDAAALADAEGTRGRIGALGVLVLDAMHNAEVSAQPLRRMGQRNFTDPEAYLRSLAEAVETSITLLDERSLTADL